MDFVVKKSFGVTGLEFLYVYMYERWSLMQIETDRMIDEYERMMEKNT